jgi:hypothetical protein
MDKSKGKYTASSSSNGKYTGAAAFSFCAGGHYPSDPPSPSALHEIHQKCGRPFQLSLIGRFWVSPEERRATRVQVALEQELGMLLRILLRNPRKTEHGAIQFLAPLGT